MKIGDILSGTTIVVSIAIPFVVFYLSLDQKHLSFGIVARSKLVDLSTSAIDNLAVSFQGERVGHVESLTLRFENSGNRPIEARDFEQAMRVSMPDSSRILSASISDATPKTLKPKIIITDASQFLVEPLLLNPGDNFSITAIVTGTGVPELAARISGLREVTSLVQRKTLQVTPSFLVCTGFIAAVSALNFWYLVGLLRVFRFRRLIDYYLLTLPSALNCAVWSTFFARAALEFWISQISSTKVLIFAFFIFLICFPAFFYARRRLAQRVKPSGPGDNSIDTPARKI